ncbi:MAG TPA: DUF2911 domain-containing protein [Ohtaekwangia sp.]|uniref:DUF2911 domain-containing protein n=1 Tax=Ohtaekwangia sp. TaxID=2066019 RepID=UPI002F936F35
MTRYILTFYCLVFFTPGWTQEIRPRTSPLDVISMRYKESYVKLTYSQPYKNGREIFGKLIPFGKEWSPGANEATEITLTKDLTFKGFLVKAGTYSIFTIPDKEKWTVIVNKDVGLWGSYNYNQKQDLIRFDVPVQSTGNLIYEPLTMKFDQRNDVADLLIMWDRTKISIPIKFIN